MKIVDPREPREFVVPHEPGIAVDLGGHDHRTAERLIDQIVLEIGDGGGNADAVILRQPLEPVGQAALEDESAVVHTGLFV